MKVVILALLSVLYLQQIEGVYHDCFWREYNGDIPADAVAGGHDLDLRTTYIGQAMIYAEGKYANVPSEIVAGQDVNYFPLSGYAIPVKKNIKILCSGSTSASKWVSTTVDDFFVDTLGHSLVLGGSESFTDLSGNYTSYIGRVVDSGKQIVGKLVLRKAPSDMTFYYINDNEEMTSDSFDILVNDN